MVLALTGAGCAPSRDGAAILDALRRDGLLDGDAARPAADLRRTELATPEVLPTRGPLTLGALLEAADRLNPRIAVARAAIGVAGGEAWQSSLYPNPTLEFQSENVRPSDGGFGVSETTVAVAQPIIVGRRRDAAVAAGAARLDEQRFTLERVRRDVHGRIRGAVTEILSARRAIELHRELIALARQTVDTASARFEARAAPESEAIRARIEADRLALAVERLRGELAEAGARLDALLGGRHVEVDRLEAPSPALETWADLPELEVLAAEVRRTHPAVLAARASIDAAERRVDLERARNRPDVTARLGAGVDHDDDEAFLEAGIGVPLPIFDRNQGNVLAARFEVVRARAEADAVTGELLGALAQAYRRWESAVARLRIHEAAIVAETTRALEQTRAGYEAGSLPFLDLLDAQRTLTEAHVVAVELARIMNRSRAEILGIVGAPIETGTITGDPP